MALRHVSLKQLILWTEKRGQKKCVLLCYIIILDQKIKEKFGMDRLQGSFWFDLDSVFDHLLAYDQSVIKTFFTLLIVPLTKV